MRRTTTIVAPALALLFIFSLSLFLRKDDDAGFQPNRVTATTVDEPPPVPSPLRLRMELEPEFEAFDAWQSSFQQSAAATDLAEGIRLASQRREAMKQLIPLDPQAALDRALSYTDRRDLPEEVQQRLEQPIRTSGDLEVVATCGLSAGQTSRLDHFAVDGSDGTRYQAHPAGARADITTKRGISLHGIAVDDVMALAADPVRIVPDDERLAEGYPERAIQVGGSIYQARDGDAIAELRQLLTADERTLGPHFIQNYRSLRAEKVDGITLIAAAPGEESSFDLAENEGPVAPPSAHTEGAKRLLYIRARFADQDSSFDPIDLSTLQSRQSVVEQFWQDNSYGKSTVTTTYTDTITLADPAASWPQGLGTLLQQARDAALAAQPVDQDWDYNNYDFYTVVTSGGSGWGYAGVAFVGGKGSHLNGAGATNLRTAGHEFGHNLGLLHANYWRTDAPSPIGQDSVPGGYRGDSANDEWIEYGHKFSTMSAQGGSGDFDAGRGHFSTGEKVRLDWLVEGDGDHVSLTESSTVRLYRHDVPAAEHGTMTAGVARSIKINRDSDDYSSTTNKRRYWLTHRWLPTNGISETWLRAGLQIDWQRESYGGDGSILLDMTPYSRNSTTVGGSWTTDNNDKEDAALIIGRTYSDKVADIHITPTGQGGSSPNQWIDVVVNLDTQAANTKPAISAFSASSIAVATNESVDFSLTASDADGDTLAYSWDFGDNSIVTAALNSTTATKSWSSAGQYVVRATASDMKGGVDTRDIVITVGSPSDIYQISGRVLHGGLPVEGARVSVSNDDQTWTEGDGTYTLAGLAPGDYTVTADAHGLTLTPQFTNPVTLSSLNVFGKDFYAEEGLDGSGGLTMVVSPYEVEIPIGATAQFTAQGWDLAGGSVAVSPSWSVSGGGSIYSAGLFTAASAGSYQVTATQGATSATATVTVLDISAVGILSLDSQAAEPGTDTGQVRVQRYGDVSQALEVGLTLGGSATSGADYTTPATTLNFSANQSTIDITITPLDDHEVEGAETIVVGLAVDPDYQVLGTQATATITLGDDADQGPEVTISSPTASPALVPPGTGLVLRGQATDDGLPDPPGALSAQWRMVSGPAGGSVSFSPPQAFDTLARFSLPGSYILALEASDGVNTASAEIQVAAGVSAGTAPSTEGQVIHYTFDEGSGTTATDSLGGDHNGTLSNGVAWTAADGGVSGSAIQLNGIDDQVDIADSADINTATHSERTISVWFKATDPAKSAKQMIYEEGGGTRGINLYLEAGSLYFGGWNNGENGWDESYFNVPLTDSDWHLAAIVLNAPDTTDGEFIVYLDGFEVGRSSAGAINAHSADNAIGAMRDATRYHDGNGSGNGNWFEGLVDDFQLWNRALSATEIGSLFAGANAIGTEVTLNTGNNSQQAVVIPSGVGLVLDGSTGGEAASWSAVAAPDGATVSFGDSAAAATTATFSQPGHYTLRLQADSVGISTGVEVHTFVGIDTASNPDTASQIIYYSFDEGSGTTAGDSIGSDNNGTLTNGPTWTAVDAGISGSALSFDGSDDVVAISNASTINSGTFSQRSISLWFKADAPGASGKEVLYEEGGSTRGMSLYLQDGLLYYGGWSGGNNGWDTTYISTPVVAGQWHHAVITIDTPDDGTLVEDGLKAYLDGIFIGSGQGAEMISHTGAIGLGAMRGDSKHHDGNQSGDGHYYAGVIDEFHLWTGRVLSLDEVGALYAFGNIGPAIDAGEAIADTPTYPTVTLSGSSSDDGRWRDTLTSSWSLLSGPAAVSFSNPDSNGIDTTATLSAPGAYTLRLTADDGDITTFADLSVTAIDGRDYQGWSEVYTTLSEAERALDANPDLDTLNNLEEYAYGGNPAQAETSGEGILPTYSVVQDGGSDYFEFQFRRRRDFADRGLSYIPEFSPTMEDGSWTTEGISITSTTEVDVLFELVTIRIDDAITAVNNKGFVRMRIELNE